MNARFCKYMNECDAKSYFLLLVALMTKCSEPVWRQCLIGYFRVTKIASLNFEPLVLISVEKQIN